MTEANSELKPTIKLNFLYFNDKTDMTSYLSYAKIGTGISLTA